MTADAVLRAQVLLDDGREDAARLLVEAVRAGPAAVALVTDEARGHDALAVALLADGWFTAAEREARRTLAHDPTHAGAHVVLGTALAERGDLRDGLGLLELSGMLEGSGLAQRLLHDWVRQAGGATANLLSITGLAIGGVLLGYAGFQLRDALRARRRARAGSPTGDVS